mgnify:CR=1 FL=1
MNKSIGERIKFIRKEASMTQAKFGDKLRLSQDQISAIELGKRTPQLDTLDLIEIHFGINKDWLINGTGEMYQDPFHELDAPEELKELGRKILRRKDDEYKKIIKIINTLLDE